MARAIDIEQLLIWAYKDEAVHQARVSRGPSLSFDNPVYSIGALGTRVDGGGLYPVSLPEDALTVEAAVNRMLAGHERQMVAHHAATGTRPDVSYEPPYGPILTDEAGEPLSSRRQAARKPRLMTDNSRNAKGCYVRFEGTTIADAQYRWLNWVMWHGALTQLDAALRAPKVRLKTWELAAFSLPRMPWRDDPAVPRAFVAKVFFTKRKNIDNLSAR